MPPYRGKIPTTLLKIHRLSGPPLSYQKGSLIATTGYIPLDMHVTPPQHLP